jgi:hypothetical protein
VQQASTVLAGAVVVQLRQGLILLAAEVVVVGAPLLLRLTLVFMPVMAVLAARLGAELHLQMLQQTARQAARALARPLVALLVLLALLALQALRLLLVDCSGRAEALVVVDQVELAVQAVQAAEVLAAVAARVAVAITLLALAA